MPETVTLSLSLHWVTFGLGIIVGWISMFGSAMLIAKKGKDEGTNEE